MLYPDHHTDLYQAFKSFVHQHQLIEENQTTLLAVSGGVDSVVMSELFYRAKYSFAIAHCNFGLRGQASLQDEAFVQRYQVNCYTHTFDTLDYAQQHGLSIQMAARQLRYQWFEELCDRFYLAKIATAHHQDDILETLLFNLTKGTGIAGLHGILPQKGKLIRPLLFADKNSLMQYAQVEKLAWREDATNAEDTYARNLLRNQVIPVLKVINPNLTQTNQLTVERLSQVDAFFQEKLAILRQELLVTNGQAQELVLGPIQDKPWAPVVIWELLKPFGFNFIQVRNLLVSQPPSGRKVYSTHYELYIDRGKWILTPHTQCEEAVYTIADPGINTLDTPTYSLQMSQVPQISYQLMTDKQVAALDLASLQFPLTIRKWQPGDFFYPLGMNQPKKVSDFLVDLKVPRPYKEQVHVLISNQQIVWIIGYRIDNRFKLKPTTQTVYEMRLLT